MRMSKKIFRSRYDTPHPEEFRTRLTKGLGTRTCMSYFDDVNIHSIYARGMNNLPKVNRQPIYGANLHDMPKGLQGQFDTISEAKNFFNSLPDEIIERFDNSPEKFVEFVKDPSNHDEGIKLGLFTPDKPNVFEQSVQRIADLLSGNQQKTGETPVTGSTVPVNLNTGSSASST